MLLQDLRCAVDYYATHLEDLKAMCEEGGLEALQQAERARRDGETHGLRPSTVFPGGFGKDADGWEWYAESDPRVLAGLRVAAHRRVAGYTSRLQEIEVVRGRAEALVEDRVGPGAASRSTKDITRHFASLQTPAPPKHQPPTPLPRRAAKRAADRPKADRETTTSSRRRTSAEQSKAPPVRPPPSQEQVQYVVSQLVG